ncbi:MAG: sialate O-acetylesterase [Pirellulales bacterium]
MKLLKLTVAVLAIQALVLSSAQADVTVSHVFGDHMVLQRDLAVPVWGKAAPGEAVTVTLGEQTKEATADKAGDWIVRLSAMKANAVPQTLSIAGKNKLDFNDVLIGEVWICSGQSNMAWIVGGVTQSKEEIAAADYPNIRHITVPRKPADTPQTDFAGTWSVCSPKTAGGFTAVGYFFGRKLHQELNVPIGLINSSWGGTRIEPWTSLGGFKQVAEQDFAKPIIDSVTKGEMGKSHQSPARLYRGMITPLKPYGIRGAIWYQGESNGSEGITYYHKKHALVGGWREAWDQGDFPFYWVQLANFRDDKNEPAGGDGYAKIRDFQRKAQDIKNTGMAVIIDIGETKDIHPKNKQDVGARLAQWALAKDYGKEVVPSGPLYKKHTVKGKAITVQFDNVGAGLIVGKKEGLTPVVEDSSTGLKRFAIAGEDKVWVWADAIITGDTVVVSSAEVASPVAVRYGYSGNPLGANLYNKDGFPASPFRTDDW